MFIEALRYLYVPAMLAGLPLVAVALVSTGSSAWWLAVLLLVAIGVSFTAERLIPYLPDWNLSHGDRGRDFAHFVVNESLSATSIASLPLLAAVVPSTAHWPHHWPLVLQVLLAIVVADAGITITHYFSHRWEWLWRFHAVHHSVTRMYGFNGLMKHPVHQAIETSIGTAPLLMAGMPLDVASLLAFTVAVQLLLQHSNVDMRIGPLRRVLALAPVHRFHHLRHAGEGDVNFGLFTTLWDRLLGTAYDDTQRHFRSEDLGMASDPDYPVRYRDQLLQPFGRAGVRS